LEEWKKKQERGESCSIHERRMKFAREFSIPESSEALYGPENNKFSGHERRMKFAREFSIPESSEALYGPENNKFSGHERRIGETNLILMLIETMRRRRIS
jgi:hypothetical protein